MSWPCCSVLACSANSRPALLCLDTAPAARAFVHASQAPCSSGAPRRPAHSGTSLITCTKLCMAPHAQIHRDTAAGRALFKLYGGDEGKQAGNSFNDRNKRLHQAKLATGWSPPPKGAATYAHSVVNWCSRSLTHAHGLAGFVCSCRRTHDLDISCPQRAPV